MAEPFCLFWRGALLVRARVIVVKDFRLGVLGSGKGSNLAAIADECASGAIAADVTIALSDLPDAGLLARARERGIPARFIPPGTFRTKLDDIAERTYIAALKEAKIDLVVLAGFMRVLKGEFLSAFEGRVVNIHPSLLPAFPGLEAWKQALDHGVKVTGCTVHLVDQGVDSGPILAQQAVPVMDNDTPESLLDRIQQAERVLYPSTLAALAQGRIVVRGRRSFRNDLPPKLGA
jgi:phosphoribosylglycinamide formyltransferase-1